MSNGDPLGEDDLLGRGMDPAIVARLLRDTPHTGNGGRPVVFEDDLDDLLGLLEMEGRA